MPTLFSPVANCHRRYSDQVFAKGGNGSLFGERVWLSPAFLFKEATTNVQLVEKKCKHLLAIPPVDGWAWPTEVHLDRRGGAFKGARYPLVHGPSLMDVANRASRGNMKLTFSLVDRVRCSTQLLTIHDRINRILIYLGDVHPGQYILGFRNGRFLNRVTGIDLDGSEIHTRDDSGRSIVLPCGTGIDLYLPIELHGANRSKPRTLQTEASSVATIVFQLMTDGRLPYQVRFVSGKTIPGVDLIARGLFPPVSKLPAGEEPISIPFASWPTQIQNIFVRMFHEGHSNVQKRPPIAEMLSAFQAWSDQFPNGRPATVTVPQLPALRLTCRQVAIASGVLGGVMLCGMRPKELPDLHLTLPIPKVGADPIKALGKSTNAPKLWRLAKEGSDPWKTKKP